MAETLTGFLKENVEIVSEVTYVASNRFKGADGKPLEWHIRVMGNKELDKVRDKFKKRVQIPGTRDFKETFDSVGFTETITAEAISYPDLYSQELQDSWHVNEPVELLKEMLTPGEFMDLTNAVSEALGYEQGFKDKVEKVKN